MPRRGSKEAREISKRGGQTVSDAFKGQLVPAAHETFGIFTGETANPLFLPNVPAFFGGDPIIPGSRQLSGDIGNVLFPGQQEELEQQLDQRFVTGLVPPPETPAQATGRAVLTGALATGAGVGLGTAVGSVPFRSQPLRPGFGGNRASTFRATVPEGVDLAGSTRTVSQVDDEFQAARAARQSKQTLDEVFGARKQLEERIAAADQIIAEDFPEFEGIWRRRREIIEELNGPHDITREAALFAEAEELRFQGNDIVDVAHARAEARGGPKAPPKLQSADTIPPGGTLNPDVTAHNPPPSPTAKSLLQFNAEQKFLAGDIEGATALRQELIRMEGSQTLTAEAAERAGLGPVSKVAPPGEARAAFQNIAGESPLAGEVLPKTGKHKTITPGGVRQGKIDNPLFDIEDVKPGTAGKPAGMGGPGRIAGELTDLRTPLTNVPRADAMDVTDFFADPKVGGRDLTRALDEVAAEVGAVPTRATGTTFGPGQQAARNAVARGQLVEVPGFGSLRQELVFDPNMNARIKQLVKRFGGARGRQTLPENLTPADKLFLKNNPDVAEAVATFSADHSVSSPSNKGAFGISTQNEVGFNALIDQIFDDMLARGKDPQTRQTGGRIA